MKQNEFFSPLVIGILAAIIFAIIVITYIVVMKTCCKKSDFEEDETIDDINNVRDLNHLKKD